MAGTDDVVEREPETVAPASGAGIEPGPVPRRHATLVYTVLRVVLLLVTLGVLWLLGARGLLWLLLGFLVSGLLSLVLLSRQRDAMSTGVSRLFGRVNDRIEASKRAEDDDVDDDEDDGRDEDLRQEPADRTGDDVAGTPGRDAG